MCCRLVSNALAVMHPGLKGYDIAKACIESIVVITTKAVSPATDRQGTL